MVGSIDYLHPQPRNLRVSSPQRDGARMMREGDDCRRTTASSPASLGENVGHDAARHGTTQNALIECTMALRLLCEGQTQGVRDIHLVSCAARRRRGALPPSRCLG